MRSACLALMKGSARTVLHLVNDNSHLMIRGAFAAVGQPFMVPRSARC